LLLLSVSFNSDDDASGAGGNAAAAAAAAVEEASLEYQFQMMRCLRDVNVDSHAVGWYQSTFLGSYLTQAMIDTQYQYQSQIKNAVVLIYDPIKSNQGTVALQAFRLTPAFMHIYASRDYTKQSFEQRGLTFSSIFTEVPIRVHANILTQVLLRQLDGAAEVDTANHVLSLNASSFLEKNLELLIESIDDLTVEQSKFAKYAQITLRHTQLIATWQARRRTENAARLARGEKPLSETKEDAMAELNIKFPQEPSRLEALLLSRQLAGYCSALTDEAESSEAKLRAVEALRHAAAKV
jgi:translation initiation factor 3 subunit H